MGSDEDTDFIGFGCWLRIRFRFRCRSGFLTQLLYCDEGQGVGSAEDIDKGMKLGTAHKMGPLHLADFIGAPFCHWGSKL